MKKNRYKKILHHLKSTELDEKIQRLSEGPTNSIDGVYSLNPPGFRLGGRDDQDPERVFYPDVDGNWPAGIPGTPGEFSYTRPRGYWDSGPGTVPAIQTTAQFPSANLTTVSGVNGTNTDAFIRPDNGLVLSALPPNSRNFILGPLIDGYVPLHGYDDFTNIGYIQKDTRQYVLLAKIDGHWSTNLKAGSRTWNGTSSGFTSYNANFTLEHAQWFRDQMLNNNFVPSVPYKYSGGVPQDPSPGNPGFNDGNAAGGNGGDGFPGGSGNDEGEPQQNSNHGGLGDAGGPFFPPPPRKKKDEDEIAQLSDTQDSNIDMMLLKGLQRGDYGTGSDINRQIQNLQRNIRNKTPGGRGLPQAQADKDTKIAAEYGAGFPKIPGWMKEIDKLYKDTKNKPYSPGTPRPGNPPPAGYGGWNAEYEPQGTVISENRRRILREIKKPYVLPEIPKQKYKMNFSGKFKPQNTPDVTASSKSDELVASGNAKGRTWRTHDKYWQGYETTERMNIIYDRVGHGDQAWEMIIGENQNKKKEHARKLQEHLNTLAHERVMRQENADYVSPFRLAIQEQETIQADKDPLFKKVSKRLKKEIDYPDKPAKNGYPNDPPPEMVNGMHPDLVDGKQIVDRFNRLDPQSAKAMPPTGNVEIDKKVRAAAKKPK